MIGVDIKALLDKCDDFCTAALHAAAGQAVNRAHYEVTIEHFLAATLADGRGDIPLALARFGADPAKATQGLNAALDSFRAGNAGRPVFSPLLLELLEAAWLISSVDLGFSQTRSGAVLLAFLRKPAVYAQGDYAGAFSAVNREELLRGFGQLANASDESAVALPAGGAATGAAAAGAAGPGGESFIAKFCEDFTAKARAGKIDPVFGRDMEIRQMVYTLARRRKNNPILVGEPGVGKTAVLEGLALRIVEGDVPDVLAGVTLLSLDLGLLEAGASMKGEFERRLKGVLDEIKASEKPIVLFIDEAHMLVGAGGAAGGSDAANLMKPALARGEIRTCAATTWKEYKKYFEKDPALARRFQLVKLDEPTVETAGLILRGAAPAYEKAHGLTVSPEALAACVDLSHRYITGRFLPDKAFDLLDTACARVKVDGQGAGGPLKVTAEAVAEVVSDWTGIPVGRMAQEQAATIRDLETLLGQRIQGQGLALAAIAKGLQASAAGLKAPEQPLGVFLLVGPSGVGKTETGLSLAELLFGDAKSVVTVNMSEFQEKHTVSRLIGSPPGYVGYGEGGLLTEAVRRRPYSVVLLDEAEKAHIDVLNLFYQVFDKGSLTDGEGTEVNFRNTIIMLTSNLASDIIQKLTAGGGEVDMDSLLAAIRPCLSQHFRPALLARMTIVPYRSLAPEALGHIADLKLQALARRLKENSGLALTYSPAVAGQIVARCQDTETGARNIEYILNGSVLPRLSRAILERMSEDAMPGAAELGVDGEGGFTLDLRP